GSNNQFSRDGRRLMSWAGSTLTLMDFASGAECRVLPRSRFDPGETTTDVEFSPDSRWLACVTSSGVRLWDLAAGKECAVLPMSRLADVKFLPAGDELITAGYAGIFRWPMTLNADSLRIGPAHKAGAAKPAGQISLDREGRMLAVGVGDGGRVLDLERPT